MLYLCKKTLRGWIQKSISVSVKVENKQFHIFYILCPINQNQNILSTSYPLRNSNNSDINGRVLLEVILRTLYYYYCIVDINICKEDGKGHIG